MEKDKIMQVMQGSKIADFEDVINTHLGGFVIDLDVKECFSIESRKSDQTNDVKLDSTKRTHREKYKENWTNTLIKQN